MDIRSGTVLSFSVVCSIKALITVTYSSGWALMVSRHHEGATRQQNWTKMKMVNLSVDWRRKNKRLGKENALYYPAGIQKDVA